jgi:hypothetical protein
MNYLHVNTLNIIILLRINEFSTQVTQGCLDNALITQICGDFFLPCPLQAAGNRNIATKHLAQLVLDSVYILFLDKLAVENLAGKSKHQAVAANVPGFN